MRAPWWDRMSLGEKEMRTRQRKRLYLDVRLPSEWKSATWGAVLGLQWAAGNKPKEAVSIKHTVKGSGLILCLSVTVYQLIRLPPFLSTSCQAVCRAVTRAVTATYRVQLKATEYSIPRCLCLSGLCSPLHNDPPLLTSCLFPAEDEKQTLLPCSQSP